MSQIIITEQYGHRADTNVISIERANMLRAMRRRRVAKRMYKRFPLFAVEEMQTEFPNYDYDAFVADITRKTKKGKTFRRAKPKAFDWALIQKEIPDFFAKCIERTKTKAVLRGRMKNGVDFTVVIKSYWHGDQGECRFRTGKLIELWKGPIKTLLEHPAVGSYMHDNELSL
jgi:hypothetical protein